MLAFCTMDPKISPKRGLIKVFKPATHPPCFRLSLMKLRGRGDSERLLCHFKDNKQLRRREGWEFGMTQMAIFPNLASLKLCRFALIEKRADFISEQCKKKEITAKYYSKILQQNIPVSL